MMWTTKDGRRLPLGDMSVDHLKNAAAMLRRNGFVTEEEYEYSLGAAFSFQGEMAQMCAENSLADMRISRGLAKIEREIATRERP